MSAEKRIQLRGVCCVCGRLHALKKDGQTLVNHGYTVEWGYFDGTCGGTNNVHYGHSAAPAFLADYIEGLRRFRESLPTRIESVGAALKEKNEIYQEMKADPASSYAASSAMRGVVARLGTQLANLNRFYHEGIQSMIGVAEKAIADWEAVAPVAVDLDVEAREVREAKAQAKAAKDAERKAKALAQAERKDKALNNANSKAAKLEAALKEQVHCALLYQGATVKSWIQAFAGERDALSVYATVRADHWLSLGEPREELIYNVNDYALEVRRDKDGKAGMCIYQVCVMPTLAAYRRMFQ